MREKLFHRGWEKLNKLKRIQKEFERASLLREALDE